MPLWTRFALATALIVAAAVATASTIQSWVARRAVVDQARSGAESLADVIAKAAAFVEEAPRAAEAEIGAQMLTQARLVAEIVGLAEQAGIPRDAVLARLREVADQGAADFLATDATGAAILETDPVTGAFRRGPDRNSPAVAQAFQRLLEEGELSSLVQESRKREGDDLAWKYVGVRGGAEGGLVQVGMEAAFLERLDREIGLRRLVTTVAGGGVREVRFLDARGTPVVTRRIDASGNASDAVGGTSPADEALVREANAIGRPAGRAEGDTFRAAASVRRADGVPVGAVIVAVATDTGPSLTWSQLLAALASALAVGVPAILAVLWMTGRFVRPVIDSTAATDRIAAGDLSIDVPAGGDDETGLLLSSVGRMTDSLREILGRIRVAGTRLATLEGEVSSSLSRQERAVRGFTGTTSDVSGAVAQIAANSEHLLTATGNVTAAAREAARVADEGREGLESMSESMRQLDDAMNAFTRKLSTIRQRASGITAVVTTIAKVADQTNLLSVNATIEAEKAGEAGRGFRIVAQEIRRLADQTALATKDIERMVRDMQSAVSSGTMEMDRFRKEVSSRIEEVAGVSDQLARIVAPVQAVTNSLESVHDGMESQSAGTRQIRDCMERLRSGAGGTASATEAFTTAMNDIRMSIADLNEEIARFRTEPARLPD